MLAEAAERRASDYFVKTLVIDDESMDDAKIAAILEGIKAQSCIKSITIMNCTAGPASVELLNQLLERKFPEEVGTLRLINVKGLV